MAAAGSPLRSVLVAFFQQQSDGLNICKNDPTLSPSDLPPKRRCSSSGVKAAASANQTNDRQARQGQSFARLCTRRVFGRVFLCDCLKIGSRCVSYDERVIVTYNCNPLRTATTLETYYVDFFIRINSWFLGWQKLQPRPIKSTTATASTNQANHRPNLDQSQPTTATASTN